MGKGKSGSWTFDISMHICANRAYYIIQVYTLVDGVLYRCPGTCVMNGVGSQKKKTLNTPRTTGLAVPKTQQTFVSTFLESFGIRLWLNKRRK